jgi:hypothetical protein
MGRTNVLMRMSNPSTSITMRMPCKANMGSTCQVGVMPRVSSKFHGVTCLPRNGPRPRVICEGD